MDSPTLPVGSRLVYILPRTNTPAASPPHGGGPVNLQCSRPRLNMTGTSRSEYCISARSPRRKLLPPAHPVSELVGYTVHPDSAKSISGNARRLSKDQRGMQVSENLTLHPDPYCWRRCRSGRAESGMEAKRSGSLNERTWQATFSPKVSLLSCTFACIDRKCRVDPYSGFTVRPKAAIDHGVL